MNDIQLNDEELLSRVRELSTNSYPTNDETDNGELQDVVNSKDEIIGTLPRGVIWDNDLQGQTRVVNVFVIDQEGKILLPVRSVKKRYLPGGYDFSCGENLKAGEEYENAVERGLKEELKIDERSPKEVGSFSPDHDKGTFCFGKVYVLEIGDKSELEQFNSEEIERLEWRGKEEVFEMMREEPEKFKRDYKAIFMIAFGSDS